MKKITQIAMVAIGIFIAGCASTKNHKSETSRNPSSVSLGSECTITNLSNNNTESAVVLLPTPSVEEASRLCREVQGPQTDPNNCLDYNYGVSEDIEIIPSYQIRIYSYTGASDMSGMKVQIFRLAGNRLVAESRRDLRDHDGESISTEVVVEFSSAEANPAERKNYLVSCAEPEGY